MDYDRRQQPVMRINWDMDGVLAQLHETVLAEYNRRFDDSLTAEDTRVYHISEAPGIRASSEEIWEIIADVDYASVPGYPDVLRIARHFADQGVPSSVVSSLTWNPPNVHAMMKRQWIKRLLGDDFAIIFTHDKHWCCRSAQDILIDDKAENVIKWPGHGLLLERLWNRDERDPRVESCSPEGLHQRLLELTGA